ncbi:hypothetical protein HDV00_008918 [Rhizophlyctis rosea]|nr:hypothetical protein HDV00_008918 [Rhizophlyctis rosea]
MYHPSTASTQPLHSALKTSHETLQPLSLSHPLPTSPTTTSAAPAAGPVSPHKSAHFALPYLDDNDTTPHSRTASDSSSMLSVSSEESSSESYGDEVVVESVGTREWVRRVSESGMTMVTGVERKRRGSGVTNGWDVDGRTIDWFNKGLTFTMAGESQRLGGSGWFLKTTECKTLVDECEKRVLDPLQTAAINSPSPSSLSVSVEVPLGHALRLMRERNNAALALYALEQEYTPDTDEVTDKPVYRGIVNILDILSYIVGCLTSDTSDDAPPVDPDALFAKQIGDLLGKTGMIYPSQTRPNVSHHGAGGSEHQPPSFLSPFTTHNLTAESNATLFPGRSPTSAIHKGYLDIDAPIMELAQALSSGQHWIFIRTLRSSSSPLSSSPSSSLTPHDNTNPLSARRPSLATSMLQNTTIATQSSDLTDQNTTMRMISQADLVWFLHAHQKTFRSVFESCVEEAMMQSLTESSSSVTEVDVTAPTPVGDEAYARGTRRVLDEGAVELGVISVSASSKALTAFETMNRHRLQAVAIVDDEGRLVGELRATDLYILTSTKPPSLSSLLKTAAEFASLARGSGVSNGAANGNGGGMLSSTDYLSCGRSASLGECVGKMLGVGVCGRCWVVDEERRPIGVVTLSDVITMVLPEGDVGE